MSTPARAIQAGIASHTRPSGNPEENDSRVTEARRQLPTIERRLAHVPGLRWLSLSLVKPLPARGSSRAEPGG